MLLRGDIYDSPAESFEPLYEPIRTLLADADIPDSLAAILSVERLGCTCDLAFNGVQAIAMFAQFPYGLVLMDCDLPLLDGYQAAAAMRRLETGPVRVPIFGLSVVTRASQRERCRRNGMDELIAKPVQAKELAEKLASLGLIIN